MISIDWKGKMVFEGKTPAGNTWTMDASADHGGQNAGPTPLEAFVGGAAACSAMDVIHILKLKKQAVDSYRVEVDGERDEKGPYPRPYRSLVITHVLTGDIDAAVLNEAVQSSDAKFCSAIATLRAAPTISSLWKIDSN